MPLPVKSDSFNAQPKAPAFFVAVPEQSGASGWALNEEISHSSPGAVYTTITSIPWDVKLELTLRVLLIVVRQDFQVDPHEDR